MNYLMFSIGSVIFILYITGLLYMISKGHKDQQKDMLNDPELPKNFKEKINK